MIKIIIKKYIKDYENIKDKKVRENYIKLSGVLGIIINLLVSIVKFLIGTSMNSIAVIGDALNNLTDIGSSLMSVIIAKIANKPPDKNHPHGHGRFEYIGSLIVALIIIVVGIRLVIESVERLMNPLVVEFNLVLLIILSLSVLVKIWMFSYNMYIYRKINSSINRATAYDSISDSIATSLVVISMVAGRFTTLPVDGIIGIFVSLLIIYSGFDILRGTVSLLLGSTPDSDVVDRITDIIESDKLVIECHDLEIHDYGPGRILASIHAEVSDTTNIVKAHRTIDRLEKKIKDETDVDIAIHMDPISTDTAKIEAVKSEVLNILSEANINIALKDFRIAEEDSKTIVMFAIQTEDGEQSFDESEMKEKIKKKISSVNSNYEVLIDEIDS